MTSKEIIEGNKLIAEFMGKTIYPVRGTKEFKKWKGTPCDYEYFEVKYHSSWDWLMPVCKKINESVIGITLDGSFAPVYRMLKGLTEINIEATWLAVVEFIKWYNQNQNS